MQDNPQAEAWQIFQADKLQDALTGEPVEYKEFLRAPSLTCGIYHLQKGSTDMQTPHDDDEVYYVIAGRAQLRVGNTTHNIQAGSILYVRATEEHSLFEIEQDLTLLVFFSKTATG